MYGGITMKKRHGILTAILAVVFALSLVPCAFANESPVDPTRFTEEWAQYLKEYKEYRDQRLEVAVPHEDYEPGTVTVVCHECSHAEFEAFVAETEFTVVNVFDYGYKGFPDVVSSAILAYPEDWSIQEAIDAAESHDDIVECADPNWLLEPGASVGTGSSEFVPQPRDELIAECKEIRDKMLPTAVPGVDYVEGELLLDCGDYPIEALYQFIEETGFELIGTPIWEDEGIYGFLKSAHVKFPESMSIREAIDLAESYDLVDFAGLNGIMTTGPIEKPINFMLTRIAGETAAETAAKIDREMGRPYGYIIVRNDDYADALSASAFAGTMACHIMLTDPNGLSPEIADAINRYEYVKPYVFIIGGEAAISPQVVEDLRDLGVEEITRIAGENSYDTSVEVARVMQQYDYSTKGRAIIASSMSFQDALSIAPIAYSQKIPVILQTWGETSAERGLSDEARQLLEEANSKVIVVGGEGAVSDASLEGLKVQKRLWGETGYDTSFEIAKWATRSDVGYLNANPVVLASGAEAPKGLDALAGSVFAGSHGRLAPLILVNGNEELGDVDLTAIERYLEIHDDEVEQIYFLGGEYVMPEEMKYDISDMFTQPFDSR